MKSTGTNLNKKGFFGVCIVFGLLLIPEELAACFSDTSILSDQTSRRHIPEDSALRNHRYENLKSDGQI
jgi:hypothetical protein